MADMKIVRLGDEYPNIREYLDAKDSDGKLTNVSDDVHALFANATEVKDDNGNVVALNGDGVNAVIADASLKDEKNNTKYVQAFVALEATTLEGAVMLMSGKADVQEPEGDAKRAPGSVCSYFNSAYLQVFRNNAVSAMRTQVEGPEKKLDKAAELIAKALKIPLEDARKRVRG